MKVYQAICAVQAELSRDGITKNRRNQQQNYNFRGIDDVYNALAPMLAKNGLCILPRILSRECTERQTQKGGALFYVVVEAEFDLIAAEDGSKHTIRTFGEAMDSADKATNKAMSAAYKYAAMQAFAIPTEGDNDADATTHTIVPHKHDAIAAPEVAAELNDEETRVQDYIKAFKDRVAKAETEQAVRDLWRIEGPKRREHSLVETEIADLTAVCTARVNALTSTRGVAA